MVRNALFNTDISGKIWVSDCTITESKRWETRETSIRAPVTRGASQGLIPRDVLSTASHAGGPHRQLYDCRRLEKRHGGIRLDGVAMSYQLPFIQTMHSTLHSRASGLLFLEANRRPCAYSTSRQEIDRDDDFIEVWPLLLSSGPSWGVMLFPLSPCGDEGSCLKLDLQGPCQGAADSIKISELLVNLGPSRQSTPST